MSQSQHVFGRPATAPAKQPKNSSAMERQMMATQFQQGKFADVEAFSRTLTQNYPKDPIPWKLLGAALHMQNRLREALTAMQMAAKLDSNDWEAFQNLGTTHLALENWAFAQACFERVLALKPDSLVALDTLADLHRRDGKNQAALALYRQRLSLTPQDSHTQHMINTLSDSKTERASTD